MADRLGVETIDREGRIVVIKFRPQAKLDPVRLVALVRERPDLTLVPPASLKLDLGERRPTARHGRPAGPRRSAAGCVAGSPEARPARAPNARAELVDGAGHGGRGDARVHEGGDLRPAKDDPRAPGGMFERVGGLLSELARPSVRYAGIQRFSHDETDAFTVARCSSRPSLAVVARVAPRRNHRAGARQGERRDLHQDRPRAAAGGGAPPDCGQQVDPKTDPTDAQLRKALAEVTPELIVNAVDEMLLVQRGRELGYKMGDEQFKSILENIKKDNKIETDEQFQAALKQEEHDDGPTCANSSSGR